ncbi:hypothetical protein ACH4TV_00575 [Streptomyces sp. NPDC020898]|uniref:hypothetical protein n=1 Tax=Streptomyces sp. NPDC020898 TaxID=3365101 RepID=UPI0037909C8B
MGVRGTSPGGRVITMDTLIRTKRALRSPRTPLHLPIPDGMTAPLGYDAVSVPARFGPRVLPRLPRLGCVYADADHWWWLVPADSDYALEWPAPAHYATGAVVLDAPCVPPLLHRPDDTLPYTPPIPLYLALCQVTGTTPTWSRPISA